MSNSSANRAAAGFGGFALLAAGITAAVLVAGSSEPAAAADLQRFASCEAIEDWAGDVAAPATTMAEDFAGEGGAVAREAAPAAAGAPAAG